MTYDLAIYYPIMELACGRVNKIEGFHYLYNFNTGLNDHQVFRHQQSKTATGLSLKKPLDCDKEWVKKMELAQHG